MGPSQSLRHSLLSAGIYILVRIMPKDYPFSGSNLYSRFPTSIWLWLRACSQRSHHRNVYRVSAGRCAQRSDACRKHREACNPRPIRLRLRNPRRDGQGIRHLFLQRGESIPPFLTQVHQADYHRPLLWSLCSCYYFRASLPSAVLWLMRTRMNMPKISTQARRTEQSNRLQCQPT